MPDETSSALPTGARRNGRALLIGDRIETAGLERSDVLSAAPLAFRAGAKGFVTLFRYGVVALVGLTPLEEDEVLRSLRQRIHGEFARHEDETAAIELSADKDDQIPPGGPIYVCAATTERLLVITDALAKSAELARDEREVAAVFDVIEPFARTLDKRGRTPRRAPQDPAPHRSGNPRSASASPAASRCRRSPTCSGTGLISSGYTPGWRTSTS
jgi:uncharacterized Rmd1/YagE family protein